MVKRRNVLLAIFAAGAALTLLLVAAEVSGTSPQQLIGAAMSAGTRGPGNQPAVCCQGCYGGASTGHLQPYRCPCGPCCWAYRGSMVPQMDPCYVGQNCCYTPPPCGGTLCPARAP